MDKALHDIWNYIKYPFCGWLFSVTIYGCVIWFIGYLTTGFINLNWFSEFPNWELPIKFLFIVFVLIVGGGLVSILGISIGVHVEEEIEKHENNSRY